MGTRATIHIYEEGRHLVSLYKQFDGYPTGLGHWLGEFLTSGTLVNGIPVAEQGTRFFNGAGDLAAQLIAELKLEGGLEGSQLRVQAGGVYVTEKDDSQEYNYTIRVPVVGFVDGKPSDILIGCDGHRSTPPIPPKEFLDWALEGDYPEDEKPKKPKRIRPLIKIPKE